MINRFFEFIRLSYELQITQTKLAVEYWDSIVILIVLMFVVVYGIGYILKKFF